MGPGRPERLVVLWHGLFSSAEVNWLKPGTAAALLAGGWSLLLPDLRGHGQSDHGPPHDAWPDDALARDAEALLAAHDPGGRAVLGGYSLGARTVVRLMARRLARSEALPRAAILAGMGLDGIVDPAPRGRFFLELLDGFGRFRMGNRHYPAQQFLKANVAEPERLRGLLDHQAATPLDVLGRLDCPILVVAGEADEDNGPAPALAAALPKPIYKAVPGGHMSSVGRPELARAMLDFLARLPQPDKA